ncbi:acyl-CoA dehydrogenase family protein [Ruegeria pomeroyi]|uniref:Acyl-CoA dehydrogenase family protein n=1 Tax=Ruegeria pomeroyi TaxID=89184 RepID=A0A9Q3ZMK7_9RHOB|nr:acyl-CoA dehydrogenase family protein [Ruegeria pomeroyi]MCE8538185.1 acyl-CoA dehydrogenase family protein [Ruegeria pomeroyi]
MDFAPSPKAREYEARLAAFMAAHVYPAEQIYHEQQRQASSRWSVPPVIEELKAKARAEGLWNLFLPDAELGAGLSVLEYAPLAELTGRSHIAPEVFNCNAPDSGNMETLFLYGTEEQKDRWLRPLLAGEIRSAFLMTEPDVASSDATNIECEMRRDGDDYVINGRKWWSSGAGDPRCRIFIVMGKTDPSASVHAQQSMVLVPADTPGVTVERHLPVFGYDDAPHGHMEVSLTEVRVPVSNVLLGEGRGFEIAQGRLGPGRIHHCMRSIGAAERALELMTERLLSRKAFGKAIGMHSVWEERVANARLNIEMTRLICLKAAWMMGSVGNKAAKDEIAMIKIAAPSMAARVIDDAIQAFGGAGVCDDTPLAWMYAAQRALRLADGPDEVHRRAMARSEFKRAAGRLGIDIRSVAG